MQWLIVGSGVILTLIILEESAQWVFNRIVFGASRLERKVITISKSSISRLKAWKKKSKEVA